MNLKEKLASLRKENRAILAVNFYNYETLRAIVTAVKTSGESVILQLSESSIHYMGIETAVAMARSLTDAEGIDSWLHLDHGKDVGIVNRCIEAGFDSVMIDGSQLSFTENVKITSEAVNIAAKRNVCVEAELGYVAKLGQEQTFDYTDPEQARRFVEETGVDALAVAVGSAHGFYTEAPRLALDVIEEIRLATNTALVLHGSSGIPHDQIQQAVRMGINKVNLATEVKDLFMKSLGHLLENTGEIDLRIVFPEAIGKVSELVENKLYMLRDR
jgi:fructose-bisphosphate aldolase class II/tagatose 1,6-diphosphate aldolase GatY/KbaY